MKLAGIAGKGTGKLGTMVFASAAGEQIVRQYQPSVSNPNTTAQVNNRAKLKLMSQVAAAVSGEIAIPRQGLKSPRNLFIKKNYDLATAADGVATLDYASLQFTNSSVALPGVSMERAGGGIITASLTEVPAVSRVVYLCYKKTTEGALQFVDSEIATEADGLDGNYSVRFNDPSGDVVVYAYGMRDMSANASAKYGNYSVTDGTALATLVMNRTLSASDYQFTATSGATLFEGQDDTEQQAIVGLNLQTLSGQDWGDINLTDGDSIPTIDASVDNVSSKLTMNASVPAGSTVNVVFRPTSGTDVVLKSSFTMSRSGYTIYLSPTNGDIVAEVAFWNNLAGQAGSIVATIDGTAYTMSIVAAA